MRIHQRNIKVRSRIFFNRHGSRPGTLHLILAIGVALVLVLGVPASRSSQPRMWIDAALSHLVRGETHGVMITSSGEIRLALPFEQVADLNEAVIWDAWKHGDKLYIATGHSGRVYQLDIPSLKYKVIADLDETEAQTLAFWKGKLYIAANPGAVLYRWDPNKQDLEVVWHARESYIWDIMPWHGNLYIATGDQGRLYRIGESGRPTVVLDASDQNLVRLFSNKNFLYVGAASNGTVYQVADTGKVSTVIPAGRLEVGGLGGPLAGSGWNLIVASIGQPIQPLAPEQRPVMPVTPVQPGQPAPTSSEEVVVTAEQPDTTQTTTGEMKPAQATGTSPGTAKPQPVPMFPLSLPAGVRAGEVWAIDRNLHVIRLWQTNDVWIYDVTVFNGRIWIAAGSPGRIYSIDGERRISLQGTFEEENVVRLIPDGQALWVLTGNPARVYRARTGDRLKGVYLSSVKDAGFVSYWGMLQWKGVVPKGASVRCFARSGNTQQPDSTWSQWFGPIIEQAELKLPPSRYFQYRCELDGSWKRSPRIQDIRISFLPQNQPPRVESVKVMPSGVVFREMPTRQGAKIAGSESEVLNMAPPGHHNATPQITSRPRNRRGPLPIPGTVPGQELYKWGMQTVLWQASDPDNDDLEYAVYLQRQGESEWHLLKEHLKQPIYAWDTSTMPDGWYRVRVVASDEAVNPPGQGLKDERISRLFPVDHTPPVIRILKMSRNQGQVIIRFQVKDALSPIVSVEYASVPNKWETIYPLDRILDHLTETFELRLPARSGGVEIQIRAIDSGHNIGVVTVKRP